MNKQKIAELPSIILNERQLFDLEMLLNGGFAPLNGFLTESDYNSVIENNRLVDGSVWPMPITLDIDDNTLQLIQKEPIIRTGSANKDKSEVVLRDEYNTPIAFLKIESVYRPDKEKEAKLVYGTTDILHPGVSYIFNQTKEVYIGGSVSEIQKPRHFDFKELRLSPGEVKDHFLKNGISKIVAFQTRNPIHKAHFEMVKKAAKEVNAHALIHPVVGPTKEGDIDYLSRVQSYRALLSDNTNKNDLGQSDDQDQGYGQSNSEIGADNFTLAVLPLAMRMAGPREALWHALIRKNYGATHFIVGRDHAGPGKNSSGQPFYGAYEAQEFVKKFENEIGISIITFPEQAYHALKKEYVSVDETSEYFKEDQKNGHILNISGTEFRRKLLSGEDMPEWFSFPEVIKALRKHATKRGNVILFTGLSGSGKSTLARHLKGYIETEIGKPVTFLDGDIVRKHLTEGLGFSKEDRIKNITRIGYVASEIAKHGGIVLVSLVAPYEEARQKFRKLVEPYGHYSEIYVKTPLETLRDRDTKGYYLKSEIGLMNNLTGIHDVYEEPVKPDLIIDTSVLDEDRASNIIKEKIKFKQQITQQKFA